MAGHKPQAPSVGPVGQAASRAGSKGGQAVPPGVCPCALETHEPWLPVCLSAFPGLGLPWPTTPLRPVAGAALQGRTVSLPLLPLGQRLMLASQNWVVSAQIFPGLISTRAALLK